MTTAGRRGRQRGFTLIELMIALTISALLVAMILSIFTRMSTAFRTQQAVAELQRTLTAGQDVIQRDVRQAGFQLLDGFRVSGTPMVHAPVELRDNASGFGPDELHVFYADATAQARVDTALNTVAADPFVTFAVDNRDRFAPDDLVVITNRDRGLVGTAPNQLVVIHSRACVGQILAITGTAPATITLRTDGDWGEPDNNQCDDVRLNHATATPRNTMVYRFVARGYRIDATRRSLGVLQQSPSGGLRPNDWQDMGLGFTDLQVASRWYEGEDLTARATTDTPDLDTDPLLDWYSGADQNTLTATTNIFTESRPLLTELRVTLVVRTRGKLQSVGTAKTPALTDPARPDNNDLGNRGAVTLDGVPDSSRPEELRGDAIYRYATVGADLRNLAVAR